MQFTKPRMITHGLVTVEKNCCVVFEEKKFCALGATITPDYIFAYLSGDGKRVTTWEGKTLSIEIAFLEKRFNPFDIYGMDTSFYIRFSYEGKVFSGVCGGKGMYLKARVTKLKSIWS